VCGLRRPFFFQGDLRAAQDGLTAVPRQASLTLLCHRRWAPPRYHHVPTACSVSFDRDDLRHHYPEPTVRRDVKRENG
jgi:hypothetical protein